MNTLTFHYIIPQNIEILGTLLKSFPQEYIDTLQKNYAVIGIDNTDKVVHQQLYQIHDKEMNTIDIGQHCHVYDIMECQILNYGYKVFYEDLIVRFGKENVSKFVHEEPYLEEWMDKTKRIIDFTIDKVYQSNELLIKFLAEDKTNDYFITFPHILYTLLYTKYNIIQQKTTNSDWHKISWKEILINRKENNNA